MRKLLLALLPTVLACAVPIDSVDGLAGGTVSSDITAPNLTATSAVTAESANIGSVNATDVATTTVTANTVVADEATVNGPAAASSLHLVDDGAPRAAPFMGRPVGVASFEGVPGYDAVNAACATEIDDPAAHVCHSLEIGYALSTAPDTLDESFDGAAFNTFGFARIGTPTDLAEGGTTLTANDCNSWLDNRSFVGEAGDGIFPDAGYNYVFVKEDINGDLRRGVGADRCQTPLPLACCL